MLYSWFSLYVHFEIYENILKLKCWLLTFTWYKALPLYHFLYDFWRKMFLLYSINWPIFIDWLPLLLEILGNICIVIICYPVCDIINLETKLSFLIKLFSGMTKKSFETKSMKLRAFFIIFKGLSLAINCLRSDIEPLTQNRFLISDEIFCLCKFAEM